MQALGIRRQVDQNPPAVDQDERLNRISIILSIRYGAVFEGATSSLVALEALALLAYTTAAVAAGRAAAGMTDRDLF